MLKLTASIIALLFISAAVAQPPRQFTFTHYSTENGLLSNQVNSVIQDSIGFIWIGTNDGLIRYDGSKYRNFRHIQGNPASLPANQVLQLKYDLKKNLWVLLSNGKAGIFNTSDFTFREAVVRTQRSQSLKAASKKLIVDDLGNIMLLFQGQELVTYNEKINEFSSIHNFIYYKKEWNLNDVAQQPGTRKYWMGFNNSGLAVYNRATGSLSYKQDNVENEKIIEGLGTTTNISELMFDHKERLWFSSFDTMYSHIYCYDFKTNRPYLDNYNFIATFKSYYEVNGFYQKKDGTIWMRGFKAFGYFNEDKKQFELIETSTGLNGIDFRYISCIYEDKENMLWIGTGNNGVFSVNPSMDFFTNVPHPDRQTGAAEGDGTNISFTLDKDGSFLVGTWPDGLYRYDKDLNVVPLRIKGIDEKNTVSIYDGYPSSDSNTIWLGALLGFYAYDQDKKSVTHYNSPVLKGEAVRELAEDNYGNLWLGMRHMGVVKWNMKTGPVPFKDIPAQQVNDIIVDSKGFIWISGALTGSYVIDPATDKVVMHFSTKANDPYKLPEESVNAVLEFSDSIMVIGTPHHILLFNRDRRRTIFLTSDETIYGTISSFEKDKAGNIWVSTTSSIYRANPRSRVFIEFNRDDGIINDYFVSNSSTVLPDGRILFGAPVNFIAFNPASINMRTTNPNVRITDIRVGNKSLSVDSVLRLPELELGYDNNSLAVDFAALSYSNPFAVLYKMEGIDKDWKAADKNKQAIYSYLSPGSYVLEFRTIDAEGVETDNVLQLAIRIDPPFYRTWWFYSLLALISATVLFWIDKQRIQRIKNEQKMRIALASNLHQDVNTTLRNINVLSEIASMKSDRQPEQAKEYLKEIQYKSRLMVVAMDDVLWSVNPDNDNMAKTIERLKQVTETISGRHNAQVEIEEAQAIRKLRPDMKTRLETVIIYKLMLLVLIEELHASHVMVQLDCVRSLLQLKVFSEQIDTPESSTTTNKYIDEIRTRAASLNGFTDIEIGGKGAWFLLEVKA